MDEDGHHTVKPWEIVRFNYNHTIPPKGFADREFAFLVPASASGPLRVAATLRYRSYPQALANDLLQASGPGPAHRGHGPSPTGAIPLE